MRPPLRTNFLGRADELNYLSDLVRCLARETDDDINERSLTLARFEELLGESGVDDGSIILQDHWALFYEAQGDLGNAAQARAREIELIDNLFSIGGPVGPITSEYLRAAIKSLIACFSQLGELQKASQLTRRLQETH
jgi:hypothetical protein